MGETSIIFGSNPLEASVSLLLLQIIIIVVLCRCLSYVLRYFHQPPVIAEVIGGLILGPTALGRLYVFKEIIFSKSSLSYLKLVADLGLVLYMFLVGMELEPEKFRQNLSKSVAVSVAGILLPFGAGVGVSKLLYENYGSPAGSFTSYFIFLGLAMSITSIPVLARILASRKLLSTSVGQTTLAAAATDDAIAWCMLIFVIALINFPSESWKAVVIFVIVVVYGLFLWFAVKPAFKYLFAKSGKKGATSQSNVAIVFMALCISAWFTQAIGVHAIFGSFLIGLVIPHENGFALKITEKMEDLVSLLFVPLYFAYSGLNTQLGYVDDAKSWGFVILILVAACGGKIIGCTAAAKWSSLNSQESLVAGILMNTKGLVELIVLNLGKDAGVIDDRVFAMFVIMALVTTFMTVPLITWLYPMKLYAVAQGDDFEKADVVSLISNEKDLNVLLCLQNSTNVPSIMTLTQMICASKSQVTIFALRLVELGERMSRVIMASDPTTTLGTDYISNIFRTFARLNGLNLVTLLDIAEPEDFGENISIAAFDIEASLIIFPLELSSDTYPKGSQEEISSSLIYRSRCSVAFFGDRGLANPQIDGSTETLEYHGNQRRILFLFFGTHDDHEACVFLRLLASEPGNAIDILILKSNVDESGVDYFRGKPSVRIEKCDQGNLMETIKGTLAKYSSQDLLLVGYESYANLQMGGETNHSKEFKDFVDSDCKMSFMVIHQASKPEPRIAVV